MKKILYVASEVTPYAKSGGLADVAGSLPKELLKLGYEISIVMPRYKCVTQKLEYVMQFPIYMQGNMQMCTVKKHEQEVESKKLVTYFIDNDKYFNRNGMYCHPDEAERFAFFDKAVAKLAIELNINILHLNDWQTGPIAMIMREKERNKKIKIIYTIHNLEYNGRFDRGNLYHFDLDDTYFTPEKLEFYGDFSFTKAGLLYSDEITTVSKTYADEIQTERYGFGYDGLLKKKAEKGNLTGIINGIDYHEYNPMTNKEIYKNYDEKHVMRKKENKKALQKELGLPMRNVPMLSVISRVVHHKGFDVLVESLNEILNDDVQFVMLGMGEKHYINRIKLLKEKYPTKVSVNDTFDTTLAKRIYAGSDIFLMPSIFEPCGLSQLISFRYGTIPVARSTGGLKDTIIGYLGDKKNGNGFTFWGYKTEDLAGVTKLAIETYRSTKEWKEIVKRAMNADFSWTKSAKEYAKLYD